MCHGCQVWGALAGYLLMAVRKVTLWWMKLGNRHPPTASTESLNMLNCKIKPCWTPAQKYSGKSCCKRSVLFQQGFKCTFSKCYLFVPLTALLGKSCQVEDFSRLLKIFLGIGGLGISKHRQLWAVGPALCCGSVPVAPSGPAAPIIHKKAWEASPCPRRQCLLPDGQQLLCSNQPCCPVLSRNPPCTGKVKVCFIYR